MTPPPTSSASPQWRLAASGEHAATEFLKSNTDLSLATVRLTALVDFTPSGEGVVAPLSVDAPSGKKAFLAIARLGEGAVAVVNNSADRSTGDFVISPFFVPLLYETVGSLAGDPSAGLNLVTGEAAMLPVPPGTLDPQVSGPEGALDARLEATPRGLVCAFTPETPGFYEVTGVPVAANPPASEANLRPAPRDDLTRAFAARSVDSGANLAANVERGARGVELAPPLLVLAMGLLGLEMLLVYVFKRCA